jgi:hypothetical protein
VSGQSSGKDLKPRKTLELVGQLGGVKAECPSMPLISGGIVTVRSRSTRFVDLLHEFPYRNLGI